jgi:holliday junction DNA helicase RuvA
MGDWGTRSRSLRPCDDGSCALIASVNGRVAAVSPDGAVVEVGGIGLAVQCTPGTIARLQVGETARLSTSLVVREDSLTLYGFADDDERSLFELLQTANGVGPRLAQAVLAIHPPREVRRAVSMADVKALMQVPGIGKKGAERLILELRDRLGSITSDTSLDGPSGLPSVAPVAPWRDQLTAALVSLGWNPKEAETALGQLAPVADEQIAATGSVEIAVLLRQALQLLGRS